MKKTTRTLHLEFQLRFSGLQADEDARNCNETMLTNFQLKKKQIKGEIKNGKKAN